MRRAWMKEHDIDFPYDLNVWSDKDGKLTLTAYRLMFYDFEGKIEIRTDTLVPENYKHIDFYLPDDFEEILHILDRPDPVEYLARTSLEDYDDWVSFEFLTRPGAPARVIKFLDSLTLDYEPRTDTYERIATL